MLSLFDRLLVARAKCMQTKKQADEENCDSFILDWSLDEVESDGGRVAVMGSELKQSNEPCEP